MDQNVLGKNVLPDGPPLTVTVPATLISLPGSIAGSGSFVSTAILTGGMPHLALSAKMSQNGTLQVQRYLDGAALVAVGSVIAQALTANTQSPVVEVNDGKVWQSFKATLINAGTVAATPNNLIAVLQSK